MQTITLYKQIHPSQCRALSDLGFKSLVNLRFDNECQNQPTTADISKSAIHAGLVYHHLPINTEDLHRDSIQAFAHLINSLPHPVMVFCGTGSRAKRIYQCAVVSGLI